MPGPRIVQRLGDEQRRRGGGSDALLKILSPAVVVVCGALTAACASTSNVTVDSACLAFSPITFSGSVDSVETVRQVREHNAAWRAICDD